MFDFSEIIIDKAVKFDIMETTENFPAMAEKHRNNGRK